MANPNQNKPSQFKDQSKKFADDVSNTLNDAGNKARASYDNTQAASSNVIEAWFTQGKANFEKFSQSYGQNFAAGGKEHVEALNKSGNAVAKGFEDLFKTYTNLVQTAAERNSEALKSLLNVKTLSELTETHTRLAQENLDGFLGGVTTLSEISVRVASDALAPINEQISAAVRKAGSATAA